MLADVLAPKQIKEDAESLQIWGKDWTNGFVVAPSAVVFPESIEQLQDLVAYARASDIKLVPSGGRTGLSGGAVASQGEVVVSFDRMNKILDFSAKDRIVTCQPGVITGICRPSPRSRVFFIP
jgi:FAD/FMN-containing dehydrogenase